MARAIWSGSINFGLVHIPIKLFTAARPKDIRFRELHDADGSPIHQKRVCEADGKEVEWEHVAKGYEISKDRFVMIKPEELDAIEKKEPHTIDIEAFVELGEIEPIHYKQSYYVMPDKGATKPYQLLAAAMKESNKAAIARLRIRTKESVAALRVIDNAICLSTLYYADEIVPLSDFGESLPQAKAANARELALATQIIDSLAREFDPSEYKDEYRERVLELIEKKAEGEKIEAEPAKKHHAKVVDLMAALQASLAEAERKSKPAKPRKVPASKTREHAKKRKAA